MVGNVYPLVEAHVGWLNTSMGCYRPVYVVWGTLYMLVGYPCGVVADLYKFVQEPCRVVGDLYKLVGDVCRVVRCLYIYVVLGPLYGGCVPLCCVVLYMCYTCTGWLENYAGLFISWLGTYLRCIIH